MRTKYKHIEVLVFANIALTLFLFWFLYSQITYLTKLLEEKLPLAIPELRSHTAIVINPMTGSFILVSTPLIFSIFLCLLIISVFSYFFFKRSYKKSTK